MQTGPGTRHTTPPIACKLESGEYKDRLAWIAKLRQEALLGHERRDLVLELRFAPEAAARVRELVRREERCCGFLAFDLREEPAAIRLMITAPEQARPAADTLFEPFVPPSGVSRAANLGTSVSSTRISHEKVVRRTAAASSAGALVCGVCCVLPFAFPMVALATAGSVVAWLGGAHGWVTAVATTATAGAWARIWRQSARSRVRPARSTLYMMGLATVFLALALVWPFIEPHMVRALRGGA